VPACVADRADKLLVPGDLVDEPVTERLCRIERLAGAEVGGNFVDGAPSGQGDPFVQPVETRCVVVEQTTELARPPGDRELGIGQAKPRMR
jgi:hypothetical protein